MFTDADQCMQSLRRLQHFLQQNNFCFACKIQSKHHNRWFIYLNQLIKITRFRYVSLFCCVSDAFMSGKAAQRWVSEMSTRGQDDTKYLTPAIQGEIIKHTGVSGH